MCNDESVHTQTPLLEVPSLLAHSYVLHSSYILMHTKWGVALAVMQLPGPSVRHHTEEQHPSVSQSRRGLDLAICITAASCCCKPSHFSLLTDEGILLLRQVSEWSSDVG